MKNTISGEKIHWIYLMADYIPQKISVNIKIGTIQNEAG